MTDVMELAEKIASSLLEAGSTDNDKAHRIQFKGGDWPDHETSLGGFGKEGLAMFLGDELTKALLEYRWVSVSERLPEDGQDVWYYFEVTGVNYGRYDATENVFYGPRGFLCGDVTHWIAAPPTPQVNEQEE